jgi:hypothetical protein
MGWGYCGPIRAEMPDHTLREREVGYMIEGSCDQRWCENEVNRGLGHVCGQMHHGPFSDEGGCGRYYCPAHLGFVGPRGGCGHRGEIAWGRTRCQLMSRDGSWSGDPRIVYCACREWEYAGKPLSDDVLEDWRAVPGYQEHVTERGYVSPMRSPEKDEDAELATMLAAASAEDKAFIASVTGRDG